MKLIRLQEHKIGSYYSKVRKIEEGFEGGLYTIEEAKLRKQKSQETIASAQQEIDTLKEQLDASGFTLESIRGLR